MIHQKVFSLVFIENYWVENSNLKLTEIKTISANITGIEVLDNEVFEVIFETFYKFFNLLH